MPGFDINGFGGGPSNTVEVRRKHRWQFEVIGDLNVLQSSLLYLLSASRPNFKFEEPEMHHNQEVVRFAGKQDWDPVTLTWYDAEQEPDVSGAVYQWINTVCALESANVAPPSIYKKDASLTTLTGAGDPTERWSMYGSWPVSANWQELDFSSTDLLTCECTMRYDRAIRSNAI